jgi:hypothetical protein
VKLKSVLTRFDRFIDIYFLRGGDRYYMFTDNALSEDGQVFRQSTPYYLNNSLFLQTRVRDKGKTALAIQTSNFYGVKAEISLSIVFTFNHVTKTITLSIKNCNLLKQELLGYDYIYIDAGYAYGTHREMYAKIFSIYQDSPNPNGTMVISGWEAGDYFDPTRVGSFRIDWGKNKVVSLEKYLKVCSKTLGIPIVVQMPDIYYRNLPISVNNSQGYYKSYIELIHSMRTKIQYAMRSVKWISKRACDSLQIIQAKEGLIIAVAQADGDSLINMTRYSLPELRYIKSLAIAEGTVVVEALWLPEIQPGNLFYLEHRYYSGNIVSMIESAAFSSTNIYMCIEMEVNFSTRSENVMTLTAIPYENGYSFSENTVEYQEKEIAVETVTVEEVVKQEQDIAIEIGEEENLPPLEVPTETESVTDTEQEIFDRQSLVDEVYNRVMASLPATSAVEAIGEAAPPPPADPEITPEPDTKVEEYRAFEQEFIYNRETNKIVRNPLHPPDASSIVTITQPEAIDEKDIPDTIEPAKTPEAENSPVVVTTQQTATKPPPNTVVVTQAAPPPEEEVVEKDEDIPIMYGDVTQYFWEKVVKPSNLFKNAAKVDLDGVDILDFTDDKLEKDFKLLPIRVPPYFDVFVSGNKVDINDNGFDVWTMLKVTGWKEVIGDIVIDDVFYFVGTGDGTSLTSAQVVASIVPEDVPDGYKLTKFARENFKLDYSFFTFLPVFMTIASTYNNFDNSLNELYNKPAKKAIWGLDPKRFERNMYSEFIGETFHSAEFPVSLIGIPDFTDTSGGLLGDLVIWSNPKEFLTNNKDDIQTLLRAYAVFLEHYVAAGNSFYAGAANKYFWLSKLKNNDLGRFFE